MSLEKAANFATLVQKEDSAHYPEFGGYSHEAIINNLHISSVVTQVSTVEFIMNDILANQNLPEGFSEVEYLAYIESELIDKRITVYEKCKFLISVIESVDGFDRLAPDINHKLEVEKIFSEWRAIRNRFAHGQIIFNTKHIPIVYFSGECFCIEVSAHNFFNRQAQIVKILEQYSELQSPYCGKPVLKDPNNTPDNPK